MSSTTTATEASTRGILIPIMEVTKTVIDHTIAVIIDADAAL